MSLLPRSFLHKKTQHKTNQSAWAWSRTVCADGRVIKWSVGVRKGRINTWGSLWSSAQRRLTHRLLIWQHCCFWKQQVCSVCAVLLWQPQQASVRVLTFSKGARPRLIMEFNPPLFTDTRKCDEVRQRNGMKVSQEERRCFCQGI